MQARSLGSPAYTHYYPFRITVKLYKSSEKDKWITMPGRRRAVEQAAVQRLGAEIRRLRREAGLSLAELRGFWGVSINDGCTTLRATPTEADRISPLLSEAKPVTSISFV